MCHIAGNWSKTVVLTELFFFGSVKEGTKILEKSDKQPPNFMVFFFLKFRRRKRVPF